MVAARSQIARQIKLVKELEHLDSEVALLAVATFGTTKDAAAWLLCEDQHALPSGTPIMIAKTEVGKEQVLATLHAIKNGVYH